MTKELALEIVGNAQNYSMPQIKAAIEFLANYALGPI